MCSPCKISESVCERNMEEKYCLFFDTSEPKLVFQFQDFKILITDYSFELVSTLLSKVGG